MASSTTSQQAKPQGSADPTLSLGWRWLSELWPLEERSELLRDPAAVASISIQDLHAMHKSYLLSKKEEKGRAKKDTPPPVTVFAEEKDDCQTHLHSARWLRYPITSPKDWFTKMPIRRQPVFKALKLKFFGGSNCLASKTIEKCHDRSETLSLKHFHTENATVASRSKKEIKRVNDEGEVENEVTDGWKSVVGVTEAREAIHNYFMLMFHLWPLDPSPVIMARVLEKYNWVGVAGAEPKVRVSILTAFFNCVLQQNADRAINGDTVLSFDEQEELLKTRIQKAKYPTDSNTPTKSNKSSSENRNSRAPASNSQSGTKPTGGKSDKLSVKIGNNSYLTCFGFNALDGRVCQNKNKDSNGSVSTVGCFSANGKLEFAHVCSNQKIAGGPVCGGAHRRKDHR